MSSVVLLHLLPFISKLSPSLLGKMANWHYSMRGRLQIPTGTAYKCCILTNAVTRAVDRHVNGKVTTQLRHERQVNSISKVALTLWLKGKISPKRIEQLESFEVLSAVKMWLDCLNKQAVRCEDVFFVQIILSACLRLRLGWVLNDRVRIHVTLRYYR
jgi:hypothetical protein